MLLMLSLLLTGCGTEKALTLDRVLALSQKGEDLSWEDFEDYPSQEVGHGLYILLYEVDENFWLYLGGVPGEKPQYIRLTSVADREQYVDIRTGDVPGFIQSITGK